MAISKHPVYPFRKNPGEIEQIGFAFATFSSDDPAAEPTDGVYFIEFLSDCDPEGLGDPVTNGKSMKLLGYCGDMVQLKRSSSYGFLQKKHVNILTYTDMFPQTQVSVAVGIYLVGETLPEGLYHAATDGSGAAEIIASDGNGKTLTYTVENLADVFYTVYLPAGATVIVSEHGRLTSEIFDPAPNQALYRGGRILTGTDTDLEWISSGWQYSVHAADTPV